MAKHRKHEYKTPEARAGHKYNESAKHRRRESEGMRKYEESHHHKGDRPGDSSELYHKGREYYGPGYGEPSNLPTEPMMHKYPKAYQDLRTEYPDTLREIDRDMEDSFRKVRDQESDSMY